MSNEHTAPAAVGDWVRHMSGEVRRIKSVKPDGFFITDYGRNAFGETWAWTDCVKTDAPQSVTHQSNDMYLTGRAAALRDAIAAIEALGGER